MNKKNEILEQIAQVIETLPSEHLLHHAKTQDQIDEWHTIRKGNSIIAECWRSEFIKRNGDPLTGSLDNEEIDQLKYDGIWLLVRQYKALWDLVQLTEPYVKQLHSKLQACLSLDDEDSAQLPKEFLKYFGYILQKSYIFDSPYQLFAEILKETEKDRFLSCLKYQYVSVPKGQAGFKQIKESFNKVMPDEFYARLNPIEAQKLKNNFPGESFSVSWMPMTLLASQCVAPSKPEVREKLIEFNNLTVEMCDLGITACRKRGSKTWPKVRSFAWKNGKKLYGSKAGGVYR